MLDFQQEASSGTARALSPRQEYGRDVDGVEGREFYSKLLHYFPAAAAGSGLKSTHWRGLDAGQQQPGSLRRFAALWGPCSAEHSSGDPLASKLCFREGASSAGE